MLPFIPLITCLSFPYFFGPQVNPPLSLILCPAFTFFSYIPSSYTIHGTHDHASRSYKTVCITIVMQYPLFFSKYPVLLSHPPQCPTSTRCKTRFVLCCILFRSATLLIETVPYNLIGALYIVIPLHIHFYLLYLYYRGDTVSSLVVRNNTGPHTSIKYPHQIACCTNVVIF